jgi:hypothetical protein
MVLEDSDHGQPTLMFLGCGEGEHHGEEMWWSRQKAKKGDRQEGA